MNDTGSVLRKKLRPRPVKRGRSHQLLLACADDVFRKAAKAAHNLDIFVADAQVSRVSKADAFAGLEDASLSVHLDGADGALGLIAFDGLLIDALIEQQTLGRVVKGGRDARPVTEIDATLSQIFMQTVLNHLEAAFAGLPEAAGLRGFALGSRITDRAALELALGAAQYDVFHVALDLGPGAKTGALDIWYPAEVEQSQPVASGQMSDVVKAILPQAKTSLMASLPDVAIPLQDLVAIKAGTIIPVDRDLMADIRLTDTKGKSVASARLGQMKGVRAVRLNVSGPAPVPAPERPEGDAPEYELKAVEPLATPEIVES